MRKKRVMLWSLLCGIFLVGGASYLSKTEPEPLKAAEKTTATKTEKTAPVAKAKPVTLVARDEKSEIPILTPEDLPNFYLSSNPDFTQWDTETIADQQFAGMPTGWTTVYSKATSMDYYADPTVKSDPTKKFLPDNWDMLMQRSQILSGGYGTVYFNWQRVQGGGIKTITTFSGNGVYSKPSASTLGVKGTYDPEMGAIITVAANLQRTKIPTANLHSISYEMGYPYVSVGLYRDNSANAVLSSNLMTQESDLSVDKVFEMVLNDNQLDEITNPSKGDNKIQLTTSNRMPIQWNSLAFYTTNLKLDLKDDFTGFTVPVGASFDDYYSQSDFVSQIKSAEYHGVADDEIQTGMIDPNSIKLEGILDHAPDTSRVGERTIQVVFSATNSEGKVLRGVAAFPLHVTWGNSVALGGGKDYPTDISSIAFSFFKNKDEAGNDSYQLIANNGNGTYDTVPVNSDKPADVYYQVDYFAPPADGKTLNLDQDLANTGATNLTSKGSDTPASLIASWGTDGKQEVELGGVLRVYMSDPKKEWLYKDGELNRQFVPNSLPQKNYVFYQVTEDGLEPMYTNQMKLNTPAVADQISAGINTPASILSKLFNESTVANSKYLTPHEGTTLADYTFVWDFQDGAGTVSGQKNILANLVTRKNDSPYVFTVPVQPIVNVTSTAYIPYIPDLPYWENSADSKNFIPVDQIFSVAWMPNTEIDTTPGTMEGMTDTVLGEGQGQVGTNPITGNLLRYDPTASEKRIRFNNVGYYNGKVVDIQLSWTNENPAASQPLAKSYIGTKEDFLQFGFTHTAKLNSGIKDLTFEIYNHGDYDTPLNVSGYWHFSKIGSGESLMLPQSEIDRIFSLPAPAQGSTPPTNATDVTGMKYEDQGSGLMRFYSGLGADSNAVQKEMTVTYKNQTAFKLDYFYNSGSDGAGNVKVGQDTKARVEFPAPQGINQQYSKVTKANDPDGNDTLSEKFVQYVPYQSEAYHPTKLSWTLPNTEGTPASGLPLQAILKDDKWDWEVIDAATGDDASSWFNSPDGATLEAKDLTNQDFYNKFFIIQRKLKINDADPVSPDDLHTIDGLAGKYYTLEGAENQKLTLDGELTFNGDTTTIGPLESGTFTTSVNFEANLAPYTYMVEGKELTAEQVAAADLPTSSGDTQSYITHDLSDLVLGAHANMVENITMDDGKKYSLQTITIDGQAYTVADGKLDPELTEKIKYTNTPVTLSYEEFVPWLPFYEEKWKDSEKDTIPAENSFVFRYSTDPDNPTKVVAKSSTLTVKEGTPVGQELLQYGEKVTAGTTEWLVLNNLGYYNGKKVAVKMSVTPEKNAPSWASNLTTIGVGSKNFFNVGMALSMNSVKVKYEFLEQTADAWQNWKPIKISGYWSLSNMWDNKDIAIPNDLIKNIYSFNRNYKQGDTALPIQLKYAEGPDNLTISSAATGSTVPPEQTSATITYDDQEYFQYTMIAASGGTTNATVKYISSSYARIDIPAPEGLEQSVAEVTDKQYPDGDDKIAKPINQEFRQAIPYEDPKYQSQPMVWMLPDVAADTNTLKSNGQWTIVDETGTDAIKDGRFAVDNDHQNKVSAADITNDNLYDHTYTFQRNLVINDQAPVDVNSEDFDKDTNYLDSKGDVSLQVGEVGKVDPLTSPVSTKVNFAADLGFAYHEYKPDDDELVTTPFATTPTYGEAAKEVPTAGTGLITHSYNDLQTLGGEPLGENENLMSVLSNINVGDEGYTLNPEKSDPALSTPVKFTTGNNSKLAYALGAVFTFDVTPNLDFGTPKIGTKDIRQTNDWSLNVANTPKASKISVSRTPFKAENVERLLGAQLLLKFDDNATLVEKEIPVSTEEAPASVDLKTLAAKATWTIDALATPSDPQMPIGFSLNVPAGNITAGKQYKSEITFTLTDAP